MIGQRDYFIHFDKVEFLHDVDPGDLERLKNLVLTK